jgi:hypothetical protein
MRCTNLIILAVIMVARSASQENKRTLAEDVFKNIQTYKGKPAASVIPSMEALTGFLGVECAYCHVDREWEKDDKPPKKTARKMFEMVGYLNESHFGGQDRISCWTCHRGHPKPPAQTNQAQRTAQAKGLMTIAAADQAKPAEQVFRNIRSMADVPAGDFPGIMAYFSGALGVDCSHCHLVGQWDQDTPAKLKARAMLSMVTATVNKFYNGSGPLGCPDCHQGGAMPPFLP